MSKSLFESRLDKKLLSEKDFRDIERNYHGREISDFSHEIDKHSEHGAPGPDDDPLVDDELVGTETRGIKLTAKGLHNTNDGFWYFPKFLRNEDGEPKGEDGIYWYKKKRSEATDETTSGRMIEEYVGKDLEDLPFKIPNEFLGHIKKLEATLKRKAGNQYDDDLDDDGDLKDA
jgi:hypothetical protein